jgi:NHLM bacteriocin system ABC transporter ATP-binding protein
LAVGVGPARLLKLARGDLIRLGFEERLAEQVALLLDDWVVRVSRAVVQTPAPAGRQELVLETATDLTRGTRFGVRDGVAWIRHLGGSSLFLDEAPLPVTQVEARFPLSEQIWLTAGSGCRVTTSDTLAILRTGDPWAGLKDFHRAVLDEIGRAQEREARRRWQELRTAAAGDRTLVSGFSIKLAAIANQTPLPASRTIGDALIAVCRVVGAEKAIEVRPPRKSGDDDRAGGETVDDIARSSGFFIRPVNLPRGWAARPGTEPLLGRLTDEDNRPVALLPAIGNSPRRAPGYDLYDPMTDRRFAVAEELAGRIAPTGWMFYPTLPDHPLKLSDLLRFSLPRVARELRFLIPLAILGGLVGLAVPVGSGILVDQVIPEVDLPGTGRGSLLFLCLLLVALATSTAIFQVVEGLTVLRIEGKVVPAVVPAVWDRLLRLPTRFFAAFSSGDLALRAMGLSLIFKKFSGGVVATLVTGLVSLFNIGLLFWYSWRLALISSCLIMIMLAVIVVLLAGQLRLEARIRTLEGSIIGFLLEMVGGIAKLRTAGAENRAFGRWASRYADQLGLIILSRRYSRGLHLFLSVFPALIAIVVYFGAIYLGPDRLSTGNFLALSIALANVTGAVLAVAYTLLDLLDLPPLYDRVKPILEAQPEFSAAVLEPVRLGGAISLNAVSFRYPGQDEGAKVLSDVSLQVRPGEFVAIVGASGSGKSTILRLLLGFESPDSGTVTYDGRELATLDLREVRRQIGVVLQNAQLLPGDLFNNIVGFASDLTMENAWQAAKLAGLDDEIRHLPMGMHTLVGEGGNNLSGGQRQRLLIARALVRSPRILMFDEATSALDNVTQSVVTESIARALRGVTRVVIAHRLTTVIDADRIYVVKQGRIVQSGQYHQLLEEPGAFQELVKRQAT